LTSKHRYTLAFALLLPISAFFIGGDLMRQSWEQECMHCKSRRHTGESSWSFWGASGSKVTKDLELPSVLIQDFPEIHCDHLWSQTSEKLSRPWDGRLFHLVPRDGPVSYFSLPDPSIATAYAERPLFREAVQKAIREGRISRSRMAAWLGNEGVTPEEEAGFRKLVPRSD
jgi:hypothetical protein